MFFARARGSMRRTQRATSGSSGYLLPASDDLAGVDLAEVEQVSQERVDVLGLLA